uniref:Uncharacterized protein n=1 Tax=Cacopsylla melanoneura TaxID=428564 RepID=A0A8D8PWM8_9HEMI
MLLFLEIISQAVPQSPSAEGSLPSTSELNDVGAATLPAPAVLIKVLKPGQRLVRLTSFGKFSIHQPYVINMPKPTTNSQQELHQQQRALSTTSQQQELHHQQESSLQKQQQPPSHQEQQLQSQEKQPRTVRGPIAIPDQMSKMKCLLETIIETQKKPERHETKDKEENTERKRHDEKGKSVEKKGKLPEGNEKNIITPKPYLNLRNRELLFHKMGFILRSM